MHEERTAIYFGRRITGVWRKESGRFFGKRKESFLLEKNRDRIKEKKGVLKKGETIIGEGTHGFDGEDFLHG